MVEVDASTTLVGAGGPVPLIDVFDDRSQLVVYFHMWHTGKPAAQQCEGCTFNTSHVTELAYLHSRDVSYAVLAHGPYEEISRYREFMGYPAPWFAVSPEAAQRLAAEPDDGCFVSYLRVGEKVYETYRTAARGNEAMTPSYGLLDRTVYGRQESWEDSPEGWPQGYGAGGGQFQQGGRPAAQWPRIRAGRDDDLGGTRP
jgi:predicted dithiol-disulfide oxidoreductase (DUF899 family)